MNHIRFIGLKNFPDRLSHIRLFVGVILPPLLVVRTWEGTMGSNPWRDYLKDPREFDGWLQANAFVGSIVALVIRRWRWPLSILGVD